MKDKSQSKKLPGNIKEKTSSKNFIFNIIIVLLSVIIVYMGYSLYLKLDGAAGSADGSKGKKVHREIQVEVLNGCGIQGIADKFTEFLRENRFDVVQMGNYISYDVEKTIVIDRTGNMSDAYKVADVLGISRKNVIQQVNENYFLDVSVIVGKDFNNLKPYK